MQVYTSTETLVNGPWYRVHGRNRALTIAYREGGYLLSSKPLTTGYATDPPLSRFQKEHKHLQKKQQKPTTLLRIF